MTFREKHRMREAMVTRESLSEVRKAWARVLRLHAWEWYATLTFRPRHTKKCERLDGAECVCPGVAAESAEKIFRRWIHNLAKRAYGRRWYQREVGVYGFLAGELTKNGRLHFHALIIGVSPLWGPNAPALFDGPGLGDDWEKNARQWAAGEWVRLAGYADIRKYDPERHAEGHCTKYVTKEGGDGFHLFGRWKAGLAEPGA